jgi:Family of unknown function (DUF6335)
MLPDLEEDTDLPVRDDTNLDEELDAAAQGDTVDRDDEIDAMGEAAGIRDNPEKPFRGIAKVERRDERRWELDPKSKDRETGVS